MLITVAVTLLFPLCCSFCKAQVPDELALIRIEKFEIPNQNGTIRFAANGTYEDARIELDIWKFTNLQFTDFPRQEKLNLTASANNCNVEITSYRYITSNTTMGNMRLRYTVVGQGTQTFNFGAVPERGFWNVVIDGVYIGQNMGWTISANRTVIVTGATRNSNVSIIYYIYPNSFVNLANQNFLERNSVAIATAIALTITIVIAAAITKKVSKSQEEPYNPTKNRMNEKEKQ